MPGSTSSWARQIRYAVCRGTKSTCSRIPLLLAHGRAGWARPPGLWPWKATAPEGPSCYAGTGKPTNNKRCPCPNCRDPAAAQPQKGAGSYTTTISAAAGGAGGKAAKQQQAQGQTLRQAHGSSQAAAAKGSAAKGSVAKGSTANGAGKGAGSKPAFDAKALPVKPLMAGKDTQAKARVGTPVPAHLAVFCHCVWCSCVLAKVHKGHQSGPLSLAAGRTGLCPSICQAHTLPSANLPRRHSLGPSPRRA